jgi:hypothetical protein
MNSRSRWMALLLSPIGLLLLSAIRLLVVSDYNTTTATTIAESGGYINTLLGSVIPLIPAFIPYIALILLIIEQFILSVIAFILALFIAPTPLTLPVTEHLAKVDEHRLLAIGAAPQNRFITGAIVLIFVILAWSYHRSFVEAMSTVVVAFVAVALLAAPFVVHLSIPDTLHSAFRDEHELVSWVRANPGWTVLIALAVLLIMTSYRPTFNGGLFGLVAIAAAVSIFPYLYNIYPLPRHASYYETVLHQPWLEAQKITLTSGHVYHGYVLSTADYWFTVLLSSRRTIVYVRDANVRSRTVCEPRHSIGRTEYHPLIPIFYTPPPHIPSCARR